MVSVNERSLKEGKGLSAGHTTPSIATRKSNVGLESVNSLPPLGPRNIIRRGSLKHRSSLRMDRVKVCRVCGEEIVPSCDLIEEKCMRHSLYPLMPGPVSSNWLSTLEVVLGYKLETSTSKPRR